MTEIPDTIKTFHQKYIRDIGESLDDFYNDFQSWKKAKEIEKHAFSIYTKELLRKWERIAKQEGFTFTRK